MLRDQRCRIQRRPLSTSGPRERSQCQRHTVVGGAVDNEGLFARNRVPLKGSVRKALAIDLIDDSHDRHRFTNRDRTDTGDEPSALADTDSGTRLNRRYKVKTAAGLHFPREHRRDGLIPQCLATTETHGPFIAAVVGMPVPVCGPRGGRPDSLIGEATPREVRRPRQSQLQPEVLPHDSQTKHEPAGRIFTPQVMHNGASAA